MRFLIVDFEFTMHQKYGRPRVWFPEIIEVGAVVADGRGVLRTRFIMLSLNLNFGLESVKIVPPNICYLITVTE